MKRTSSEESLKKKVETVFFNIMKSSVSGVPIICGQDLLDTPPEKSLLVWAQNVGPFEDMPTSTGVRVVTLMIRVEMPESERVALLDQTVSTVQMVMEDVTAIKQVANLNGAASDKRPVKLFHVYDVDPSANPDMRSEEYSIEEMTYNVLCGEHDG